LTGLVCAVACATASFGARSNQLAPYLTADKPIVDGQGRVAVIVDIIDDAEVEVSEEISQSVKSKRQFKHALDFHRAKPMNLVDRYESHYGFAHIGMTSHVGTSFTAFLTERQIGKLRKDKYVHLITQDSAGDAFSAPPPWFDNPASPNGGEMHSWGRVAVNGKEKIPGSARRVFIIDSGVAHHDDLGSVITRANVNCGAAGGCENTSAAYQVVGCYPHATHVAGIVAAANGNGKTSGGVYAGVDVVSITPLRGGSNAAPCSENQSLTTSSIGYALDYTYDQVCVNTGGRVGVVNMSMNGPTVAVGVRLDASGTAIRETNNLKLTNLARPVLPPLIGKDSRCRQYPGALVVQSAGNFFRNSCTLGAYASATPAHVGSGAYLPFPGATASFTDDGVIVVGAINSSGLPANSFNPTSPSVIGVSTPPGSNYGACVDVWAPGDRIVSAWGTHSPSRTLTSSTYGGNAPNAGQGWAFLSGTSMAAPHVAAAAAYLADAYAITNSAALEQVVRQFAVQFNGTVDAAGQPVKIVQLP
jgi:Subtilase family